MSSSPSGTLLLVEDDPLIRSVLAEGLENEGFPVVTTSTGEEAADLLLRQGMRPPVLVTDINLGSGTSGIDLADTVHRDLPELPVIFITGRLDMLQSRGLRDREFLMAKPFTFVALIGLLRRCMTLPAPDHR